MLFENWSPEEVAQLLSMGFFDPRFYLNSNSDLQSGQINVLMHYLESGWREGRSPSAEFDPGKVLSATRQAPGARNSLEILLKLKYESEIREGNLNE